MSDYSIARRRGALAQSGRLPVLSPSADGELNPAPIPEHPRSPVDGKIVVVTGGAQGFGAGIARDLAAAGARLAIADMNIDGARTFVDELNAGGAAPVAEAFEVNVADEASVEALMGAVEAWAGGIDLFVANAGVLRAGSVKEMDFGDFRFVSDVNYHGFFLCTKHASRLMAAQNVGAAEAGETVWSDIVQINSKSGLVGSNKNGAYAGAKFGSIGLVQSFALELVTDHVKVNAVCPGNFFDGPLWSDPDRGLFRQYLDAGKVPGATSVADVKSFYESKVPMGRGCTPGDVAKAVMYIVDQQYETGQAIPVTGGQVMLN